VGRVALEIAVQPAQPLRDCQRVFRQGEMIHADVNVAGLGQPLRRQRQQLQPGFRRGQIGFVDLAFAT